MRDKGNATVWFAVGFLILATVIVIVAAVASSGSLDGTPPSDTPAPAITEDEWSVGPKDAKVTLIEYADFQCPACAAYHPVVKSIVEEYDDRVLFVFRNFPLYTIHPNAGISAQAAEAAGAQGKYWEMVDLLYLNQISWATSATNRIVEDHFDGYATSLGLDLDRFHKDMNSDPILRKIKRDADGANDVGVGSTPTFYLNLKQVRTPASVEAFKAILDDALASS